MEQKDAVILEGTAGYAVNIGRGPMEQIMSHKPAEIKQAFEEYKWVDGDVLVCTFAKCGTHVIWEIAQMLLNNTTELTDMPKEAAMLDLKPITECSKYLQSPKALNTHFRLDVLPEEFQNRKTITVIRNPKDVMISGQAHVNQYARLAEKIDPNGVFKELSVEQMIGMVLNEIPGKASYWKFHSYMWKRRQEPHILVLFYEDLVTNPLTEIEKVNEFLGTKRDSDFLEKIAEATTFENMKKGKEKSERVSEQMVYSRIYQDAMETHNAQISLYRKGKIGDWKNHLTVSQNERFDKFISEWKLENDLEGLHFTFE